MKSEMAEAPLPAGSARRITPGRIILVALVVGLGAWFAVRIHEAGKKQAALAAEREATAKSAGDATPSTNANAPSARAAQKGATVRGVVRKWRPEIPIEGTLAPLRESDLGFKVPGRLASVRVTLGQAVAKGEVLATLDSTQAQAQLQAAGAGVKAAEAQLALADDGARRTSALVESGTQPKAMGIQAGGQRDLAAAQLEVAKAQLALASASASDHALVAPFAGQVTKVPTGAGSIVSPMLPLFHMQDLATLEMVGTVGESDAPLVKVGADAKLGIPGREVTGKVTVVLASVDPVTRRLPVRVAVANDKESPILAGTFVRATISSGKEIAVLALPGSTLRPGSQDEVMVVASGRLSARKIAFTRNSDGELLVRHGVGANDDVLLAPTAEARDGDPVAPTAEASK
jgi:RND family efflux transporter MFP subunit